MRHTLFAFILLTQLDGSPLRLEHSQVQGFKVRGNECGAGVGTVVLVGTRAFCVKEKPEAVCAKVERYGGICER